jgi:3-oxoacyl-[acyl-carrier-protein] synthase III
MFLLGVATASPSVVVSGDEPRECAVQASPMAVRAGVRSKRLSLPLEYIRATGNPDVLEGWKVATATPTSLGVQVAKDVLAQVGITIEQVGLVLGDTGTQYQTCPSEGQRIAGEFGFKTASFDLVGGIGAVPHFLSVVSRWSAARVPEYLLYVSTNTPTQQVDYRNDQQSAGLFGDASVSLLLSKERPASGRSARVVYAAFRAEPVRRSPVVIERFVRLDTTALFSNEELKHYVASELELLERNQPGITERARFIAPQLYAAECHEILAGHGVAPRQVVSGVEDVGFALGSSHGVALAQVWSTVKAGEVLVLMHCGDGQCGSVVLEVL